MKLNLHIRENLSHLDKSFRVIRKNWIFTLVNRFVFISVILSLSVIIWRWQLLPPMVPLWLTRPWGQDQLANPIWLLLLPGAAVLWHIISILIAATILGEYRIFTQLLFTSSLCVSVLSLIAVTKIIFLVT